MLVVRGETDLVVTSVLMVDQGLVAWQMKREQYVSVLCWQMGSSLMIIEKPSVLGWSWSGYGKLAHWIEIDHE